MDSVPSQRRKYGFKASNTSDPKDKFLKFFSSDNSKQLPQSYSLPEGLIPEVYDQGTLGSCTANALGCAFEIVQRRQKLSEFTPSRLFIYYNERLLEGTEKEDSGAEIRDGVHVLSTLGAPNEHLWPYDISKFASRPYEIVYADAVKHRTISSVRIKIDLNQVKAMVAQNHAISFGFTVYSSFESDTVTKTGIMPIPDPTREKEMGGHAVLIVGYDNHKVDRDVHLDNDDNVVIRKVKGYLRVRNSWGKTWGDEGYFWMPYEVFEKYGSDAWVLSENEEKL